MLVPFTRSISRPDRRNFELSRGAVSGAAAGGGRPGCGRALGYEPPYRIYGAPRAYTASSPWKRTHGAMRQGCKIPCRHPVAPQRWPWTTRSHTHAWHPFMHVNPNFAIPQKHACGRVRFASPLDGTRAIADCRSPTKRGGSQVDGTRIMATITRE